MTISKQSKIAIQREELFWFDGWKVEVVRGVLSHISLELQLRKCLNVQYWLEEWAAADDDAAEGKEGLTKWKTNNF